MIHRLIPFAILVALAACQTSSSAGNPALVRSCTAASGFPARAEAAKAAGAEGEVLATEQELASVNACMRRHLPAAPRVRQCSLQMVGGTGYVCAHS